MLLDSVAITNVMSDILAEKLGLHLSPTMRRIVVADDSTGDYAGILQEIPVSFGYIVVCSDSVPSY